MEINIVFNLYASLRFRGLKIVFCICLFSGVKADPIRNRKKDTAQDQSPADAQDQEEEEEEARPPEITPLYISKNIDRAKTVNLLLISNSTIAHYVLIKDVNKLLKKPGTTTPISICLNCFSRFYGSKRHELLKEHRKYCYDNASAKITFPKEKKIKFRNIRAQNR